MKTKQIPAITMLLAGFIYCIIGFGQQLNAGTFLKQLLVILIIFYIIGEIAKAVLDPFFKEEEKTEDVQEDAMQEETDAEGETETEQMADSNQTGEQQ